MEMRIRQMDLVGQGESRNVSIRDVDRRYSARDVVAS